MLGKSLHLEESLVWLTQTSSNERSIYMYICIWIHSRPFKNWISPKIITVLVICLSGHENSETRKVEFLKNLE